MLLSLFRLVMEDDKVFVYHNLENSRMLHSTELQCIEVEPPVCCSLDNLLHSFRIIRQSPSYSINDYAYFYTFLHGVVFLSSLSRLCPLLKPFD